MVESSAESAASLSQAARIVNGSAAPDKAENPVARGEWLTALAVAVAVVILLQIPYILGYALARPGTEFTGVIMNPEDSQSYFAKMLEGYDGNWLYAIPFTTEEHVPAFLGGFYLFLGHLARWTGVTIDGMWHLARAISDMILFLVTFGFIANFLCEPRTRWTAYLLAVFGSGLGWVLFLLNQPYWLGWFPVDFKMPEAHLFFTALTFPHVALGTALILGSFWLTLRSFAPSGNWLYAVGAGFLNLALAIVYPFLIYLIAATLGLYWIYLTIRVRRVLWREACRVAIAAAIPAPLVLYYAFILVTNPVMRAWDAQSITLSPPLPHYLIAYGITLALALLALWHTRDEYAFLWMWLLAVAMLVYSPLNSQRRFVEGIQVPLSILAAVGLCEVMLPWLVQTRGFLTLVAMPRYSAAGLERLILAAFLLSASLSNIYILASVSVTAALQQPYPLFRARDEIAAVNWLRDHTTRADVVLGAYETGNYVAAHAGNRVVVGHWAETVNWQRKFDEVAAFYSSSDPMRQQLLKQYSVRYVWFGRAEHKLGAYDPTTSPFLQLVYSNAAVQIYRINTP